MKPGLKELDAVALDEVDQTMLSRDPPRPCPGQFVLQRLRLAHTGEGFAPGRLDQRQDAESDAAVGLDPDAKILAKPGMELGYEGTPLRFLRRPIRLRQGRTPGEGRPLSPREGPDFGLP